MWQTELLTYQLADQPESKQILSNAARLTASVESFSKTVEQLPVLIKEERQAAIKQVFDTLDAKDEKMRSLLNDTRQTFNAGNEMANSVDRAIKSLDEFVRYVSPPDTNAASLATNSRPFDVLDYGKAASQIGAAAENLESLLTSLKESDAQLARLNAEASASAERVAQHVFWKGVVLILILLTGSVLAGLSYRILAAKLMSSKHKSVDS